MKFTPLIIVLCCGLTACNLVAPVPSDVTTYTINPKLDISVKKSFSHVLMVQQPETSAIYNTVQMPYVLKPHQIAYYAKNQWADTPTKMLQSLIVEALQDTKHFKAVVTPAYMGTFDYSLNMQLITLSQNFLVSPSEMHLKATLQLVSNASGNVVAAKTFDYVEPTPLQSPLGGVLATNRAVGKMMQDISRFCVKAIS